MGTSTEEKQDIALLERLVSGYRDEITLYRLLLKLAERQNAAIRRSAPRRILQTLSDRKDSILQSIDRIDGRLASPKRWLARMRPYLNGGRMDRLNRLLDEILHLIRDTARVEAESHELVRRIGATEKLPATLLAVDVAGN